MVAKRLNPTIVASFQNIVKHLQILRVTVHHLYKRKPRCRETGFKRFVIHGEPGRYIVSARLHAVEMNDFGVRVIPPVGFPIVGIGKNLELIKAELIEVPLIKEAFVVRSPFPQPLKQGVALLTHRRNVEYHHSGIEVRHF